MKLLNYTAQHLIEQNIKKPVILYSETYTKSQFKVLCRIIIQHKIKKEFFDYLLSELYGLDNWKNLNYQQMYNIIHILSRWDYKKERTNHE